MRDRTNREEEIFDFITKTIDETGYSPSIRDIKNALGIKSTSTVHAYIEKLENSGRIIKDSGKSRSIRTDQQIGDGASVVKVPVLGKVAAGTPITAVENRDGYIKFALDGGYSEDELFALRIQGESMIDAGIMDGDTIIVRSTPVVDNGKIVVALIDDEATCKRFFAQDGHIVLQPENRTMEPMIFDNVTILGEVIACVRFYD